LNSSFQTPVETFVWSRFPQNFSNLSSPIFLPVFATTQPLPSTPIEKGSLSHSSLSVQRLTSPLSPSHPVPLNNLGRDFPHAAPQTLLVRFGTQIACALRSLLQRWVVKNNRGTFVLLVADPFKRVCEPACSLPSFWPYPLRSPRLHLPVNPIRFSREIILTSCGWYFFLQRGLYPVKWWVFSFQNFPSSLSSFQKLTFVSMECSLLIAVEESPSFPTGKPPQISQRKVALTLRPFYVFFCYFHSINTSYS